MGGIWMNSYTTLSRLGMAVAGGVAMVSFGMVAPAHAAPTGGANSGCGNYCPNGVGLPSGNGKATNQPAAGTKGKADSKNPPGQAPSGPGDANKGYECDLNQGVGKTNPAHTGCVSPY
jgi:hypothetical protein